MAHDDCDEEDHWEHDRLTHRLISLTSTIFFLRSDLDESDAWMTAAGDLTEGNMNEKLQVRLD